MPIRFRKTINLMPGVKLNLSRGGISLSVGRPGATVNFSKHGIRRTIGIPGSGLSDTAYIKKNKSESEKEEDKAKESEEKESEGPSDEQEEGGIGCSWGCLSILLFAVVVGYFTASYFDLIPSNSSVSSLLLEMTQWVRNAGF
jgi:hypothetical protein